MIKANELRIGNWYDHDGEYKQVTPNVIEDVWYYERIWCKPIPLTEEILLKAGFKKNAAPDESSFNEFMHTEVSQFQLGDFNGKHYIVDGIDQMIGQNHIELKYLHQLQNIFYALTGTELNINLNNHE